MKDRGVIYFAQGEKYLNQAVYSARSLKKFNSILPISLFTNKEGKEYLYSVLDAVFDEILDVEIEYHPLKQKASILGRSPYFHTLFLDTDTKIIGDVSMPFNYLGDYDFAIAGMRWYDFTYNRPKLIGYEKPHYVRKDLITLNTGVMYYINDDKFKNFQKDWVSSIPDQGNNKFYYKHHCDQHHFNKMLGEEKDKFYNIRIKVIPNIEYNCREIFFSQLKKEKKLKNVKIIHEHTIFLNPIMQKYIQFKRFIRFLLGDIKDWIKKKN